MSLFAAIAATKARLRVADISAEVFKIVGDAADLAQARTATIAFPAAFVVPVSIDAPPNRFTGEVVQLALLRVAVLVAANVAGDRAGGRTFAALESLSDFVVGSLVGWRWHDGRAPFSFRRGRLVQAQDGRAWWADEFETDHIIVEEI